MIGGYYWIGNTLEYISNAHDFQRVIGEKLGYEAQTCFDEILDDLKDRSQQLVTDYIEELEELKDRIRKLEFELEYERGN